jgi:membrane protease YdiL (CAAX protease family)
MRIEPSARIGLAAVLLYIAVFTVGFVLSGVDYDLIGESTGNVAKAVLLPVGAGAVTMALLTSWLRWWGPVMRERPVGPRWYLLVPAGLLLIPVLNMVSEGLPDRGLEFFAVLALACLLVGFSEEIATRGLLLVGLRGSVGEAAAWFFSSLVFALLHGLNLFFGQGLGPTVQQIAFAFVIGSALYVTRRTTGLLIVGMALHALWDFSMFATDRSFAGGSTTETPVGVGLLLLWPVIIVTAVVVYRLVGRSRRADAAPS